MTEHATLFSQVSSSSPSPIHLLLLLLLLLIPFTPTLSHCEDGKAHSELRLNTQVDFDDRELAAKLYGRLRPHLPETYRGGWIPQMVNERIRVVRYERGEKTTIHTDGSFRRNPGEMSLLTLMVYLNHGFLGGDTYFYDHVTRKRVRRVLPLAGKALLFDHLTLHEGSPVTEGTKWIIRTDIMFTHPAPPDM